MEMPQGPEKIPGMKVERVELRDFLKYKSQIGTLPYNVLGNQSAGTHERVKPTMRRKELKPVRGELRSSAQHEAIYVAKDKNEKVAGYMYIELEPDGHEAKINEIWSSVPEVSQAEVIKKFIDQAKLDLITNGSYHDFTVEAAEQAKHFRHLAANPLYHFVKIKGEPSAPASSDNEAPRAAVERKVA